MGEKIALTGNETGALAFKHVNPDVIACYPITPQTELMHDVATFVHNGEMDTEFVTVESEHSAMSTCVGAAASGARTMTATCGQGLALMWEIVYIASSYRLPIVMAIVNRALSGPINIHCDHSDTMGARDSGWIQLFCEDSQEIYDNLIMAVKIGEHPDVLLPVMVCFDGFIISHTMQVLEVLDRERVQKLIGEFKPAYSLLDTKNPITIGGLDLPPFYFEHKRQHVEAMKNALPVIEQVSNEYAGLTDRKYSYFESHRLNDAEIVLVVMGSAAGTAKAAVDQARDNGLKAGLLKLRVFRPFPGEQLAGALQHAKLVCVFDRSVSFGYKGPLASEIKAIGYEAELEMPIVEAVYGLGGRDITVEDFTAHIDKLAELVKSGEIVHEPAYIGLRE
jgi:pyruvate ferredoxin oxidoreductase alpha subunit